MQDKHIIALFQKRSKRAIPELIKAYQPYLHTISYHILKNSEDVDECLNDTYLKVWESIPPLIPLSLSSYIGKIIRNISLDRYRKQTSSKRGSGEFHLVLDELSDLVGDHYDVAQEVERKETMTVINNYLSKLTPIKRSIFILRYYHAYSIKEVAKKLDLSESNVKTTLLRERNELKVILTKKGITP